jgi:hypothetical protein
VNHAGFFSIPIAGFARLSIRADRFSSFTLSIGACLANACRALFASFSRRFVDVIFLIGPVFLIGLFAGSACPAQACA